MSELIKSKWALVQRFPLSTAVVTLAAALVVVVFSFGFYAYEQSQTFHSYVVQSNADKAQVEKRLDEFNDISSCRSKIAAAVLSAQADNDLAVDALVEAISENINGPFTNEIAHLHVTEQALDQATKDRNAFEAEPSASC